MTIPGLTVGCDRQPGHALHPPQPHAPRPFLARHHRALHGAAHAQRRRQLRQPVRRQQQPRHLVGGAVERAQRRIARQHHALKGD